MRPSLGSAVLAFANLSVRGVLVCERAARHIWFSMRGNHDLYTIIKTDMVQISLKVAITVEEFFGDRIVQNIATLLGVRRRPSGVSTLHVSPTLVCACSQISKNRIKIVGTRAGSVEVDVAILAEEPTAGGTNTTDVERHDTVVDLALAIVNITRVSRSRRWCLERAELLQSFHVCICFADDGHDGRRVRSGGPATDALAAAQHDQQHRQLRIALWLWLWLWLRWCWR